MEEKRACLLCRDESRTSIEACAAAMGGLRFVERSAPFDILIAEGPYALELSREEAIGIKESGKALFLLLDEYDRGLLDRLGGAVDYIFYKPFLYELVLRRMYILMGGDPHTDAGMEE